ncbi:hypothetical protein [Kocuria palustris]|uniref:hypothetical protein n=1 Tax=Kocuria palustris TaxID=71999 RepID=UPI0011A09AE4|nr:hypothetical protein [Kocuria palustris]
MASAPQTPDRSAPATSAEAEQVSRAPGMIASAVILLAAAAAIVVPHLVEVAVWVRVAGLVLGLVLIAAGSLVFARELRRQSVIRR